MKLIIDIPNEGYDWIKNGFPDNEDKEFLIKAVKNGTSYEDRPQGQWIDVVNSGYPSVWHYECSECHGRPLCTPFTKEDFLSRFCPNCGADMRGYTELRTMVVETGI